MKVRLIAVLISSLVMDLKAKTGFQLKLGGNISSFRTEEGKAYRGFALELVKSFTRSVHLMVFSVLD